VHITIMLVCRIRCAVTSLTNLRKYYIQDATVIIKVSDGAADSINNEYSQCMILSKLYSILRVHLIFMIFSSKISNIHQCLVKNTVGMGIN